MTLTMTITVWRRGFAMALLLVVAGILLAGCGTGPTAQSSATPTVSGFMSVGAEGKVR